MTREIPLTQGKVALVDDEDYDRVVAAGPWYAVRSRRTFYATRNARRSDRSRFQVRLHTFLTGWVLVDHRNGDGLDNRRANLREATCLGNSRNAQVGRNNTSGFKGVTFHPSTRTWRARIGADGRNRSLGLHHTPEAAARAYDLAARELWGEFAALNFPRVGERSARVGEMSGQTDPEKRAVFLASLEYGVNPIARADYSKAPSQYSREEDRTDATEADAAYQRHLASKRPTRHLVVTAADIRAGVDA